MSEQEVVLVTGSGNYLGSAIAARNITLAGTGS